MLFLTFFLISGVSSTNCSIEEYSLAFLHNNATSRYEIHGLWVNKCCNQSGHPYYCRNVTFNETKLTPIMSLLEKIWFPTNNQNSQIELMSHEFTKHGSCTLWDEFDYFSKVLCLYPQVNLSTCHEEDCLFNFWNPDTTGCDLIFLC